MASSTENEYDGDLAQLILTRPAFTAFTVVLDAAAPVPLHRYARRCLIAALRIVLNRSSRGWRVRRVPFSPLREFDMLPPENDSLSPDQAWQVSYALAEQPFIIEAEPAFATLQGVELPPPAEDRAAPNAGVVFAPDFGSCLDDAAPVAVDPNDVDWSPRLIDAPCAWQVMPPSPQAGFAAGQRWGAGVRIGHPDSGYLRHPDMFSEPPGQSSRVLTHLEKDFVDGDPSAEDPQGDHGLSTASVLMSSDQTGQIVGVAPAAEIVPLRVTKPRLGFIPAPVLFDSGVNNLRDAIWYAMSNRVQCHVISISLGWLPNESLHRAIRAAVQQNIIVCAAAGNYVRFVVWPAAYPEVLAVAGCNADRRPWSGSSSGRAVGVSAPAERVWRASFSRTGAPIPDQSDGTSYAVASTAGVAALWLAFHGRDFLLDRYARHFVLSDVFRWVLGVSSDPFSTPVGNGFGVGIINARRVLTTPLPTIAQLQASFPGGAMASFVPPPAGVVEKFAATFDALPSEAVAHRLAAMVETPVEEVDARLAGLSDEALFQVITKPDLRSQLTPPKTSLHEGVELAATSFASDVARPRLSDAALSLRLRARITG
jgi:thermitase